MFKIELLYHNGRPTYLLQLMRFLFSRVYKPHFDSNSRTLNYRPRDQDKGRHFPTEEAAP